MADAAPPVALAEPGVGPARVLLAEDERTLATLLEQFLAGRGADVVVVGDGQAALERLRAEHFDVALVDLNMPRVSGLDVLRRARALPLPPEVVLISGNATPELLAHALRDGAYDVVAKPYRMVELELLVRRAAERHALAVRAARLERLAHDAADVVTGYTPLRAVLAVVDRAAIGTLPMLVLGEPGTGKRTLAARVHRRSGRPADACVTLDCAAVPAAEHVVTLFGAAGAAGAAGGAAGAEGAAPRGRDGAPPLLALAEGGTLVLAHVDALAPVAQARMRALLDGPQGAGAPRLVATSSRDLGALAAGGAFDAALLDRLSAVQVTLPPLRERAGDVRVLAEALLRRPGRAPLAHLTEGALTALEHARWPGNVRELRAVLEAAAARAHGGVVSLAQLALPDRDAPPPAVPVAFSAPDAPSAASPASLAALERAAIQRALEEHGWHQGRAAAALGISARTLYRKIRAFGFARPRRGGRRADA